MYRERPRRWISGSPNPSRSCRCPTILPPPRRTTKTNTCNYSIDLMAGKTSSVSLFLQIGGDDISLRRKDFQMLWTVFVVLLVLWLLGVVSSYTLGGFIHILLLLALITLVFNLVSGRKSAV